jgi:hypothetical protein
VPGESVRRVTTNLSPSTTNSTGSSPGAAAGARPGIAFSSGSVGWLGLSSAYALHTINRLDHPNVNTKRFRRNRGSHSEPVGKAEPAASAGPRLLCLGWQGCADRWLIHETRGHEADLLAGFLAEEIDASCAPRGLTTTGGGVGVHPGAVRLANDPDPNALSETLQEFAENIADATQTLAESDEVQAALKLVTEHGARRLLELDPSDPTAAIGFTAEDGSLAALLRAVQPTLNLDTAGALPMSAHGSTTAAILAAAEASAAAQAGDAILIADDFGDQLDAASGEYLATRLRRQAGQLWLTTRRPEVPRAFETTELLRLTRSTGSRQAFQLSRSPDRKERVRRRHLFTLFGPAMSARTVVLLEGPHDMETYTTVSRQQFRDENTAPLSAFGMRLVPASAGGGEGGKQELRKIAASRFCGDNHVPCFRLAPHPQMGRRDWAIYPQADQPQRSEALWSLQRDHLR